MAFIYGLSVISVIFEGIIIQCEGGCAFSSNRGQEAPITYIHCEGAENPISPNRIEVAQNIDTEVDLQTLPNDVIELILSKTDFETIQKAAQEKIIRTPDFVMSRILQDHIIKIMPWLDTKTRETFHRGESYVRIGSYKGLTSFFKKFGDRIKKIEIEIGYKFDSRNEITQNIIKKYATNFEELRIVGFHLDRFWNGISDEKDGIIFPKVKKLQIDGDIYRHKFKLNSIFPKLESFTLTGTVADVNCLVNVKGLKELVLCTSSIEEHQLDAIFINNDNMIKIHLLEPNRTETMHSIAKHLTKLKTLVLRHPGEDVFLRANNGTVCKLPSVTHLDISFYFFGIGNLSFEMPHLKELTLNGYMADDRIFCFIERFKELEKVKLSVCAPNTVKCIEKLMHIKEFTTPFSENRFNSLKNIFKNFNETSKLQTIKFLDFDESLYQKYQDTMKEIYTDLKNSMKPTWTLSHGKQIGTDQNYLKFEREPCKSY